MTSTLPLSAGVNLEFLSLNSLSVKAVTEYLQQSLSSRKTLCDQIMTEMLMSLLCSDMSLRRLLVDLWRIRSSLRWTVSVRRLMDVTFDTLCKLKVVEIKRHLKARHEPIWSPFPTTISGQPSQHRWTVAASPSRVYPSVSSTRRMGNFKNLHMALPRPEQCSLLKIILITPLISWRNMYS